MTPGQQRAKMHDQLVRATDNLKLTNYWLELKPKNEMLLREQIRILSEVDFLLDQTLPINFLNAWGMNYFVTDNEKRKRTGWMDRPQAEVIQNRLENILENILGVRPNIGVDNLDEE